MLSTVRFVKLFNDYLASLSLEIGSLTGDDKENIVLGFFSSEMMKKYAPSSYWTMFSLLKDYFIENSIPFDYDSVKRFFKVKEKGYAPKKAPAIEPENIKSYLMSNLLAKESYKKIVVICGYFGALRKSEIHALKKDDLTYNETTNNFTLRFIRIKTDKASIGQTVVIPANWGELSLKNIILNYISEISHTKKVDKLFVQWCARSNKYKNQAMGVHTISSVPQDLAKHLNLPNPESSLRVSSATALAESGGTILQLKSHGGWSSDKAAEGYIRVSKKAKTDVASKLIQEDASTQLSLPLPSVSGVSNDPVSDDPVSDDPVSNDPVSTDQMCEPVGKSDAPHNNKLSLNKTSNTTKYNSPTKIKGGITNSNKNVAITITGGSCNFYLRKIK
ncbi:hypothetical protein ACTFIY_010017 [Dictyostelium cf. discoideum]